MAASAWEGYARYVQARLGAALLRGRRWRALGFARLGDYLRERLGVGLRSFEDDARVATVLEGLPRITRAFLSGGLTWTHLRLLVVVATSETEGLWLGRARTLSTRDLEALVRARPRGPGPPAGGAGDAPVSTSGSASASTWGLGVPDPLAPEEPGRWWEMRLSLTGRRLWRKACELAQRTAGAPLTQARVLEYVAAEALSGGDARDVDDCASTRSANPADAVLRSGGFVDSDPARRGPASPAAPPTDPRGRCAADIPSQNAADIPSRSPADIAGEFLARHGVVDGFAWLDPPGPGDGFPAELRSFLEGIDTIDAFEVDRRLRHLRRRGQARDFHLGVLLRAFFEARHHRDLGFASFALYVERRLGFGRSKASALLTLERDRSSAALREAYRNGRITLLAALALRPLMGGVHDPAWIARAREVTLRRLEDEITWAQQRIDRDPREGCPPPPPHDLDVRSAAFHSVSTDDIRMRAQGAAADPSLSPDAECGDNRMRAQGADTVKPPSLDTQGEDNRMRAPGADTVTPPSLDTQGEDNRMRAPGADTVTPPSPDTQGEDDRMRAPGADAVPSPSPDAKGDDSRMRAPGSDDATVPPPPGVTETVPNRSTDATSAHEPDAPRVLLAFWVPDSIAAFFEEALDLLRRQGEERWQTFERMVALAITQWIAVPRHRDPVFERDGWRCSVPGCTSRRNLHDHHLDFRSHGGTNDQSNRITVCAAHHLHAIHEGRVRARGRAPGHVAWELGRAPGRDPLARLRGDRFDPLTVGCEDPASCPA